MNNTALKLTRKKVVKEDGVIFYNYYLEYNGVKVAIKSAFKEGQEILRNMYRFAKEN